MASVITNSTSLKKFRNELLDTVEDFTNAKEKIPHALY